MLKDEIAFCGNCGCEESLHPDEVGEACWGCGFCYEYAEETQEVDDD